MRRFFPYSVVWMVSAGLGMAVARNCWLADYLWLARWGWFLLWLEEIEDDFEVPFHFASSVLLLSTSSLSHDQLILGKLFNQY